jgi:hypothetical protein
VDVLKIHFFSWIENIFLSSIEKDNNNGRLLQTLNDDDTKVGKTQKSACYHPIH